MIKKLLDGLTGLFLAISLVIFQDCVSIKSAVLNKYVAQTTPIKVCFKFRVRSFKTCFNKVFRIRALQSFVQPFINCDNIP